MNALAFVYVLGVFATGGSADSGATPVLVPVASIEFGNTTDKKAAADCEKVAKALRVTGKVAVCTVKNPPAVASN